MAKPKRIPTFQEVLPLAAKVLTSRSDLLNNFVKEANLKYRPWEKLQYVPPPDGFTALEAWAAVKFSRVTHNKAIPLEDQRGKQFTFWVPDAMLQILHKVDQGGGGALALEGTDQKFLTEAKEQIIINSLMEEAIATSQIEGAVTTRDQAKEMLRSDRRPINKSEQMVLNSYRTITMLRKATKEALSIELLNRIQSGITQGTLDDPEKAGKFRSTEDNIVIADNERGEVVFTPPPAQDLNTRVQKLVDFANSPSTGADFIHPLVKASILHFWLAYEHPYVDGNGRTARALFYWYMLKNGYWLFEYLTISRVMHEAPGEYYKSFQYTEHDENDLTYSVFYMLRVTHEAIEKLKEYLAEKQAENNRSAAMLRNLPGINRRQRELLSTAMKNRTNYLTVAQHQKAQGISYQTARTDLLELAERKLLTQSISGRQMIFWPAEDIEEIIGGKKQ